MHRRQNLFKTSVLLSVYKLAAIPRLLLLHLWRWRMVVNLSYEDDSSARAMTGVRVKLHKMRARSEKPVIH